MLKALSQYVVTSTVQVEAPILGPGVQVEVNGWNCPTAVKARAKAQRLDPQTIVLNRAAIEAVKGHSGTIEVVVSDAEADRHEAAQLEEVLELIADIQPWEAEEPGAYDRDKGRQLLEMTHLAPAHLVEATLSGFLDDAAVRNELRRSGTPIKHEPAKGKKKERWTISEWKPMSIRNVIVALVGAASRRHEQVALEVSKAHASAVRPT